MDSVVTPDAGVSLDPDVSVDSLLPDTVVASLLPDSVVEPADSVVAVPDSVVDPSLDATVVLIPDELSVAESVVASVDGDSDDDWRSSRSPLLLSALTSGIVNGRSVVVPSEVVMSEATEEVSVAAEVSPVEVLESMVDWVVCVSEVTVVGVSSEDVVGVEGVVSVTVDSVDCGDSVVSVCDDAVVGSESVAAFEDELDGVDDSVDDSDDEFSVDSVFAASVDPDDSVDSEDDSEDDSVILALDSDDDSVDSVEDSEDKLVESLDDSWDDTEDSVENASVASVFSDASVELEISVDVGPSVLSDASDVLSDSADEGDVEIVSW